MPKGCDELLQVLADHCRDANAELELKSLMQLDSHCTLSAPARVEMFRGMQHQSQQKTTPPQHFQFHLTLKEILCNIFRPDDQNAQSWSGLRMYGGGDEEMPALQLPVNHRYDFN